MSSENPESQLMPNRYLAVISAVIVLFPVEYMEIQSSRHVVSTAQWHIAVYAVAVLIAMLVYTRKRCTGRWLTYMEGLQFVGIYMEGDGPYSAFFLTLFYLAMVLPASILVSVYGDLTGSHNMTPDRYYRLVYAVYRHRTQQ